MKDRLRVFVVEDSLLVRQRIIVDVVALGLTVAGHAESQDEAVESIGRIGPDVVVTDLHLKVGSGLGVIQQVRARHPKPPPSIFVLSNFGIREYIERCMTLGADEFFDKASEYHQFLARMQDTAHHAPHHRASKEDGAT